MKINFYTVAKIEYAVKCQCRAPILFITARHAMVVLLRWYACTSVDSSTILDYNNILYINYQQDFLHHSNIIILCDNYNNYNEIDITHSNVSKQGS